MGVLDIVHGRLVYPVYDIKLSPSIAELVVTILYGAMHAVDIIGSSAKSVGERICV
jgi:hypothetical protein